MPEGPKSEAQGAQGRSGVLGDREGAASPSPSATGDLGERCKLPQRGPGRSPGRKKVFLHSGHVPLPTPPPPYLAAISQTCMARAFVQVQNGILRIQLVRADDRGVYICEAENSAGSDYATVTIELERAYSLQTRRLSTNVRK